MITLKELNPHNYPTTPEQYSNMEKLLVAVNIIRTAWGKPMTVTSGLRSNADQTRINPSAPKSNHLIGAAVDIYDPDLSLTEWLKGDGAEVLKNANLYCELGNKNWAHFQIYPPKSARRWFLP